MISEGCADRRNPHCLFGILNFVKKLTSMALIDLLVEIKFVPLRSKYVQMKNICKYIMLVVAIAGLTSCGEYQRVLKSNDFNYKFEYAKAAFAQKKYVQAATLFKDCSTVFKGTDKAEESLYLLAMSHYENKDYISSGSYFRTYYTRYPKGKYVESARFYCGYGYYIESPDPQLDQTTTIQGIEELQAFLDLFPRSDKVPMAQAAIFELQDKLTLKQLQNALLYYNLGNYLGNNYQSCIIVAQNAVRDYPYSKYKEELELLILKARFQEADQSIDERKVDRFREVIDEYYSFINNYPDTPNRDEVDNIYSIARKYVHD